MTFQFSFFAGHDQIDDNMTVEADSYDEAEKIARTKTRKREYIPSLIYSEDIVNRHADALNMLPFRYIREYGFIKADNHAYVKLHRLVCDGKEMPFNKRG